METKGPCKNNYPFLNAASRLAALRIFCVSGNYLDIGHFSRLARRAPFIRGGPRMGIYSFPDPESRRGGRQEETEEPWIFEAS